MLWNWIWKYLPMLMRSLIQARKEEVASVTHLREELEKRRATLSSASKEAEEIERILRELPQLNQFAWVLMDAQMQSKSPELRDFYWQAQIDFVDGLSGIQQKFLSIPLSV